LKILKRIGKGVGFISYGKPKSEDEIADFEIFGGIPASLFVGIDLIRFSNSKN
jgi:hypothetical protein